MSKKSFTQINLGDLPGVGAVCMWFNEPEGILQIVFITISDKPDFELFKLS